MILAPTITDFHIELYRHIIRKPKLIYQACKTTLTQLFEAGTWFYSKVKFTRVTKAMCHLLLGPCIINNFIATYPFLYPDWSSKVLAILMNQSILQSFNQYEVQLLMFDD